MALPPDFWTKPEPFGWAGMAIGFAVAMYVCFFVLPHNKYFARADKSKKYSMTAGPTIFGLVTAVCVIGGLLISAIVRMFWLGYI